MKVPGFIDLRPSGRNFDFGAARAHADLHARMFAPEPLETEQEPAPACDHRGTAREVQVTLFGAEETICGACGAIV